MIGKQDSRIAELLELAKVEGFTLALHPSIIIAMEDAGAVVNLRTGAIVIDGQQVRHAPTAQALAYAGRYEVVTTAQGSFVLDHIDHTAYAIVIPTYKGGEGHD